MKQRSRGGSSGSCLSVVVGVYIISLLPATTTGCAPQHQSQETYFFSPLNVLLAEFFPCNIYEESRHFIAFTSADDAIESFATWDGILHRTSQHTIKQQLMVMFHVNKRRKTGGQSFSRSDLNFTTPPLMACHPQTYRYSRPERLRCVTVRQKHMI